MDRKNKKPKKTSAQRPTRKKRKSTAKGDQTAQDTNTVPVKRPKTRPLKVSLKVVGLGGDLKGKRGTIQRKTGRKTTKRWHVMWDGEQDLQQYKGHQLQAAKDLEPTPAELSVIFAAAGGGQAGMDAAVDAGAFADKPKAKPVASDPPMVQRRARPSQPFSAGGEAALSPASKSHTSSSQSRPQRVRRPTRRYKNAAAPRNQRTPWNQMNTSRVPQTVSMIPFLL
jgi:hypothetical protein